MLRRLSFVAGYAAQSRLPVAGGMGVALPARGNTRNSRVATAAMPRPPPDCATDLAKESCPTSCKSCTLRPAGPPSVSLSLNLSPPGTTASYLYTPHNTRFDTM